MMPSIRSVRNRALAAEAFGLIIGARRRKINSAPPGIEHREKSMCPECQEPLVGFELDGIEIDHCVACGGTWLDPGELEQIAEMMAPESLAALEKTLEELERSPKERTQRRCPRCRKRLSRVHTKGQPPIALDVCPRGDGIWFDRGELRDLVAAGAGERGVTLIGFLNDMFGADLRDAPKGE